MPAVAYASDTDDVAAAVRAARAVDLPFTIRAGGHSVSGRSVRDGAVCIDLRALNSIDVDPRRAIVRVGGGATVTIASIVGVPGTTAPLLAPRVVSSSASPTP